MKTKRWIIFALLWVMIWLPKTAFAATHEVHTAEQLKTTVSEAGEGDEIVIKTLKDVKDFNGEVIEIDKNLTITSEMEYEPYTSPYGQKNIDVYDTAVLQNISFKVADGKTLTLSNVVIHGFQGETPIQGEGNLVVSKLAAIAAKGAPAVDLEGGTVTVRGIEYKGVEDYNDLKEGDSRVSISVKNKDERRRNYISGGDAAGDAKAYEAIQCAHFVMNDTSNQNFEITGGKSEDGKGAFAIAADRMDIDLRQIYQGPGSTLPIKIQGGNGKYPGGALRGRELNIVAGYGHTSDTGIRPGACTDEHDVIIPGSEHDIGVVEVEDGGVLNLGKDIESEYASHLAGFHKSYFYGPTILAKGNATVNIYGGIVSGTLPYALDSVQQKLAPHAVIEMGTGDLNISSPNTKTVIDGGSLAHNNVEAMILSKGKVTLSGDEVSVIGPEFKSGDANGYVTDGGSKRGAAGIKTSDEVTVTDGARVEGGTIGNIEADADAETKDQYRTGSGIVDAKKVTVSEGGVVQGDGPHRYHRGKISKNNRNKLTKISSGHGVENVDKLVMDGGFVHGGDVNGAGTIGNGTGGSGMKNVKNVVVKGDSLVTGGSSTNGQDRQIDFFMEQSAGHAVDNREIQGDTVRVSDGARLSGGNSKGKQGGHGIVGSDQIVVEDHALIRGGACDVKSSDILGLIKEGRAGSGIDSAKDVRITGGKVEAGSRPYQNDYDYLKEKMKTVTRDKNYPGTSKDAVAIHAYGTVVVDGEGDAQPNIQSYYSTSPVVRLTEDDAVFILGKGDATAENESANLVEGGMYHVDIFKNNTVNTVKNAVSDDDAKGVRYNDRSTPLFRIFHKDGEDYVDANVKGVTPLEIEGYKLYKEETPMQLNLKGYVRKLKEQGTSFGFIDETDSSKRTIDKMPADNIVIAKTYTVTFDLNHKQSDGTDAGQLPPVAVEDGTALGDQFPANPTREGYEFTGWNTDPAGHGTPFTADTPVTGDITVYAQWEKVNRTVTFDLNHKQSDGTDAGQLPPVAVEDGTALGDQFPANPTREGYEFTGWNTDPAGHGTSFTADTPVTGDITVYAQWKKLSDTAPSEGEDDGQGSGIILTPKLEKEIHFAYLFGYPEGDFRPESTMTRAEVSAMFVRLLEKEPSKADVFFSDVKASDWYHDSVARALDVGLLKGYEDGSFKPNAPITRAEFAAIAARFEKETPGHMYFTDVDESHWAYRAIASAYANGWVQGYEDNTFRPESPITRAEVATLANNMLNRHGDKAWINARDMEVVHFGDLDKRHWAYYIVTEATNGHDFERDDDGKSEHWIQLNGLERK